MSQDLINTLLENRYLRSKDEIERFYNALDRLKSKRDDTLLTELFKVFSDDADDHALQSLQTYLESFDGVKYVSALFSATDYLATEAPDWLFYDYGALFNSESYTDILRHLYKELPETRRRSIRQLLVNLPKHEILDTDKKRKEELERKIQSIIS